MAEETVTAAPQGLRDVRGAIVSAAAQLFAQRGYGATSVREVVEAAGCKKPTLYYYFDNKEQLFLEVIGETIAELNRIVDAGLKSQGSVRERLSRGLCAYVDYVHAHPTELRLLMTAERHPEQGQPFYDFDALRQGHVDVLRSVFEAGVAAGELRPDLDLEEAVLALFGMVDHRLVLFLHGRPLPPDMPERMLDLFFHGVAR